MDIALQFKDETETFQQVTSLTNTIISALQSPEGWIIVPIFFFWLIVNKDFSHVFDILERKEKRRAEQLEFYVTKPEIADSETISVLNDLRDTHYFKVATGIYAEKKLRHALINLHNSTSHNVSWRQIRRAFRYIEMNKDGSIAIRRMTIFEIIGYWYNQIVGYIIFLFAAVILALYVFLMPRTFSNVASGILGSLVIILFAMFVFAQNWPILAARKIQNELASKTTPIDDNA